MQHRYDHVSRRAIGHLQVEKVVGRLFEREEFKDVSLLQLDPLDRIKVHLVFCQLFEVLLPITGDERGVVNFLCESQQANYGLVSNHSGRESRGKVRPSCLQVEVPDNLHFRVVGVNHIRGGGLIDKTIGFEIVVFDLVFEVLKAINFG